MTSLVTGAGGFLGQYIVEQLVTRGDSVRALARRETPALQALGVECMRGDVRELADMKRACRDVEVVYHAAAVAGLWGSWRHYYDANVMGTKNVISGCCHAGVTRLVFTSSPSVTFAGRDQCGVDESAPYPTCWLAHYPHTKALAEQLVLQANGEHHLLTCALRPHLIWGPRDHHLIPRLLDRARKGQLRQVGNGQNMIDAVYVENAAAAHLLAADALRPGAPVCGKAYFITNGEPVNCWQWINQVLVLGGVPPVQKQISLRAAYLAGTALEALWTILCRTDEPRMTRFLAAQLGTSHYFDIAAARQDLGYVPRVSMAEGMRRLAASLSPASKNG
ncbi:MAG TPA: NAD-dependent epimerase/dehydratase family protein [Pirellulaceae bacterium]|nr:NAD-dependent epimerase/dehydratase family protein [Pirellulaceae bacterium]